MTDERPGILVGGGAYKARDAIREFAESRRIPVFRTWNALDVITDDSPVYGGTVGTYGGPGRNFGLQNTDELFILGCRLSGRITGGNPQTFARGAKKYWADLDKCLLDPSYQEVPNCVSVQKDASEFVDLLKYYDPEASPSWMAKCREWVKRYDPVKPEHLKTWHPYGVMRKLSQDIPANAIVVYDTGGNSIMMGHCFQSKQGQRIFSSNGNTPMGFSLCGAMGAWFAEPKRPVVCIIGDGGMQLNIQELQTIKHYEIPLKAFIFDNGILGNTKAYQRVNKKPEIACGPDGYSSPNFERIATAYGIRAQSLRAWENYYYVISRALGSKVAEVVDIWHEDFCTYEPRISSFDLPIEDMQPFLPREEFKANMYIEPWRGWEKNI